MNPESGRRGLARRPGPRRPGTLTYNPGEPSKPITSAVTGASKKEGMMPASRI
jgi:hypothetical protein